MADFPSEVDFACPEPMRGWLNDLLAACRATQPLAGIGTSLGPQTDSGTPINAGPDEVSTEGTDE